MEGSASSSSACHGVRIVSRRMVRPSSSPASSEETTVVHLTPWDLQMLTIDYIQKGVLLPKPPPPPPLVVGSEENLVDRLASSLARALARFHPFAGRLAVDENGDGGSAVTVSLRCTDEGAELVHAVAPDVTAAEVASSLYVPRVVWSFFPLDGLVGADAVAGPRPVLAAQVTELADGAVFVAMSLNHAVADGTAFWHLFNTWAEISRRGDADDTTLSAPAPVLERRCWFPTDDAYPVPVPLPFAKLEHIIRRFHGSPVEECFVSFSAETVSELKARANAEMAGAGAATTATISSLQALLAHVWRAATRARGLHPRQETSYTVLVGCRGRVSRVPRAYAGNAVVRCTATATAGEVLGNGLGWAAWQLNRAVAAQDEAALLDAVASWHRSPRFAYMEGWWRPTVMVTGNSPRFDVFGNDFGGGSPVAVRSGGANKVDGRVTVYQGNTSTGAAGGGVGMEVCLAPEALARLVVDEQFMCTTVVNHERVR